MNLIAYDLEFMRHVDIEKDLNKNLEKISNYLKRKNMTGIRFRYFNEMTEFAEALKEKIENIETFNRGLVLIIRKEVKENE